MDNTLSRSDLMVELFTKGLNVPPHQSQRICEQQIYNVAKMMFLYLMVTKH